MAAALDRTTTGWRDDIPEDDIHSEPKMRSLAKRLLGKRFDEHLFPLLEAEKTTVERKTAWRIDGTFREFPRLTNPLDCWFTYPIHALDGEGVLQDAMPEGDDPPWKKGSQSAKTRAKTTALSNGKKLADAHAVLAENGRVHVDEMAKYLDLTPRTIRERAKKMQANGWTVDGGYLIHPPVETAVEDF
jgi:hypothetical protein